MASTPPVSDMHGKTVLITGASGGIGLATAQQLARQGAHMVLVCRNPQKAEQARASLQEAAGPESLVDVLLCDLSLLSNVRTLAAEVALRYSKLDVLINNAGIMPGPFTITEEGHELSWVTNHLSVFTLTNLLLPQLLAAEQARIITLASEAHWLGQIEASQEARNDPQKYSAITAYCDSKLANILFTNELAHRLELTGITANCVHPGMVNSGLMNAQTPLLMKSMWWMAMPFMISTERGAQTSIYLASSPEVARISGKYFKRSKPGRSSGKSQSRAEASRLWRISEEETGIE